ncbi:hypothetical protein QSC_3055 [Clostridioides difficile P23]|nr:hypothetical protein QK3_3168 [Clostridioides difficile DA00145]EQH96843.1 hypothetical protein QO5_3190 [Clostridioides difficile F253]EQH97972.1 hypothetical protein QO7_3172 [Clostridioides difficile F314]EQJ38690.1 hypothetical protein QSC_3055 [Clostridioides difficile P23]
MGCFKYMVKHILKIKKINLKNRLDIAIYLKGFRYETK